MFLARVELLSDSHPASALFKLLVAHTRCAWLQQILSITHSLGLCGPFRLAECERFPKQNPSLRKHVLSIFRKQVLLPMFYRYDSYDQEQLQISCSEPLIGLGFSPAEFLFDVTKLEWDTSELLWCWRDFRMWSLVRISGRWPLPLLGHSEFPLQLICPACDISVGVLHALLTCPHSTRAWEALRLACFPVPSEVSLFDLSAIHFWE